ncbi:MAG: hypothetical protein HYY08_00180 [Firmicutes bacterium]|nr:hypothetical protein [Bacillota bacterium]
MGTGAEAAGVFPVAEITKGMRGTGKTVVEGTEIEEFGVEILGLLKNPRGSGDLVLVRLSGDLIERTGGIAAGMSGSPIYIGDRLLGALSYGFEMSDHRVGLVTPAEEMLMILGLAKAPAKTQGNEVAGVGGAAPGVSPKEAVFHGESIRGAAIAPLATPLMVSGASDRVFRQLERYVSGWGLLPMQAGGTDQAPQSTAGLEPGSALGIQLLRGDIDLTAIGTLTYIDAQGFVGFGHPLLNKGPVEFFATGAYVHGTIPGVRMPFKLASPQGRFGVLTEDRGAGVAGRLGAAAAATVVTVVSKDLSLGKETRFRVEVVRDDLLSVPLIAVAALGAMDRGLDRVGGGTSRVGFELEGEGLPAKLGRDNMFWSYSDIGAVSLTELMEAVDMVVNNRFQEARLTRVDIRVEVEEVRRTAQIESAVPSKTEVRPGDPVDVLVVLRPFRGEPEKKRVRLEIPRDTPAGTVAVSVRGGGAGFESTIPSLPEVSAPEDMSKAKTAVPAEPESSAQSLEKLLADFAAREKNSDIVVEFFPALGPASEDPVLAQEMTNPSGSDKTPGTRGQPRSPDGAPSLGSETDREPVRASLSGNPYVVQGDASFNLRVLAPDDGPNGDEGTAGQGTAGQSPDGLSGPSISSQ